MKRTFLIIVFLCLVMSSAMAGQAHVMIVPMNPRTGIVAEDSITLQGCELMKNGVVNYKNEQDLSSKITDIQEYFIQNPLQKRYSLKFMDSKTMSVVGEITVGGDRKVSFTGNENKDQLLMGIGAAVLAVLLMALSALIRRARKRSGFFSTVFLLAGIFSTILAIIWTVSLGIRMLMTVCGPALLIGVVILLLAGNSKGKGKDAKSDAKKQSETKHGYSVNGKHFDNRGDAILYVRQFPYMDDSWIKPD